MEPFLADSASSVEASQSSLTRVTYLGGILMPFSVVAAVLSMESPFGPGNKLFWVFWTASIALMTLTLIAIYADDIRRLEVWVEVAADNLQEAIGTDEGVHVGTGASSRPASTEKVPAGRHMGVRGPQNTDSLNDCVVTRVRVATGNSKPDRGSLPFHKLSEVTAEPNRTTGASADASTSVVVDDDVQEIVIEVVSAHRRRRFRIVDPLGGDGRRPSAEPSVPAGLGAADAEESVVIDMREGGHSSSPPQPLSPYSHYGARLQHIPRPPGPPSYVLERPVDGSQPKAWRRQQLGWLGAARTIVGYKKLHRAQNIPIGSAAVERMRERNRNEDRYGAKIMMTGTTTQ